MRGFAALLLAATAVAAQDVAAPPVAAPANSAPATAAPPGKEASAKPVAPPAARLPMVTAVTPNAERGVVIGAISKRTGESRSFTGFPGQSFDFGTLHVTVRTCETTPPWEQRLTGAFLLIDERLPRPGGGVAAKRIYSGWMFAESPSLHPLEHPRYDIWVKSCTMRFPERGPDSVVAGSADSGGATRRSTAKKSAATPSAPDN